MRISVVTISFNQAKFLRQCIESVLSQDYHDVEYIVVDPGSADGSREIIESYGDRIIRVFDKDSGPADGLNQGFAKATGDVLGFINADDYLLPGALSIVAAHFKEQGLSHFVSGCGFIEKSENRLVPIRPTRLTRLRYLYGISTVFQQGTFFPRSCYARIGGFNTSNRTCWDGELFLNFVCAGFVHEIVRDDLAVFRIHDGSITGSGRVAKTFMRDHDRMFCERLGRKPNLLDRALFLILRLLKAVVGMLGRFTGRR